MKSASEIITASHQQELKSALDTCTSIATIVGPSDTLSLSEQVAAMKQQIKALAAENAQMLRLLTDISENHVEYFSEGEGYMFAGVPIDYVSEINSYVSRDVNAENPFAATDAVIADIRRSAQIETCNELLEIFRSCSEPGKPFAAGAAGAVSVIELKIEQLRSSKGAA
jgi:hypothetical protein